jgi:hypothetical protein
LTILNPDRFSFYHSPGKGTGFLTVGFNWFVGMCFSWGIDTNETDLLTITKENGIPINNPGAFDCLRVGKGDRNE